MDDGCIKSQSYAFEVVTEWWSNVCYLMLFSVFHQFQTNGENIISVGVEPGESKQRKQLR